MAFSAVTVYAPSQSLTAVALVAIIFGLINLPSVTCWTVIGREIGRLLKRPAHLLAFNLIMAALLIVSLVPMITVKFAT